MKGIWGLIPHFIFLSLLILMTDTYTTYLSINRGGFWRVFGEFVYEVLLLFTLSNLDSFVDCSF